MRLRADWKFVLLLLRRPRRLGESSDGKENSEFREDEWRCRLAVLGGDAKSESADRGGRSFVEEEKRGD